jgi:ParB-like chromosome segregation protein Spo0J
MKVVKKALTDLKPAPYNPRVISDQEKEKLRNSLFTFGYVDPLVWNSKTGHVIGGNQRLMVLRELQQADPERWKGPFEVIELDLDEHREKALNLALNKISGDWNYEKLRLVFEELDESVYELTAFDLAEISVLTQELEDFEEEELPDLEGKTKDEKGYVIYLTFKTKESAESWLAEHNFDERFKPRSKMLLVRADEV